MDLALNAGLAALLAFWFATPSIAQSEKAHQPRGAPQAIMVFGGWASETNFTDMFEKPWTIKFNDIQVVGASYSRRLGTVAEIVNYTGFGYLGDHFAIEAEAGVSGRFGDESLGEVWGALYLRYDGFPWNDFVFTTIGANTGLSLLTETSDFEEWRDSNGKSEELLHYLGPEITFANPENKDLEFVFRLHHRSGVFGRFNGVVSGSTFLSTGVRVRF
jgi:hypothetical protein